MDSEEIGKRIKKYRNAKGLTQKQLGEKLFEDDKKISKWERGKVKLDIEIITKICNALDISVHDFLDGIEQKQKISKLNKFYEKIKPNILKIIIGVVVLVSLILLSIFTINNYNFMTYYRIKSDSLDLNIDNGFFLESKYKNILILHNIKIYNRDYDIDEVNLQIYTYVNGEKVIFYESNVLDNVFIEELNGYNGSLSKNIVDNIKKSLYLSINVKDKDKEEHLYESKLDLIKYFSNNRLNYRKKIETNEKEESQTNFDITEIKLVNDGFIKNEDGTYEKQINNNLEVNVNLNTSKVTIYLKSKKTEYVYYIYYKSGNFKYLMSSKDTTINYIYYYNEDKLTCYRGDCTNYLDDTEYVLNLMNKLF